MRRVWTGLSVCTYRLVTRHCEKCNEKCGECLDEGVGSSKRGVGSMELMIDCANKILSCVATGCKSKVLYFDSQQRQKVF